MDIVDNLADTDIVYIFGAWRMQDAIFARKVRQMGIPYILIPLGHISRWNIEHYLIKRIIQSVLYQKLLAKKAGCIITTSKLEDTYLKNSSGTRILSMLLTVCILKLQLILKQQTRFGNVVIRFSQVLHKKKKKRYIR